jgi:Domain of unknown function (DUF1707)
MREHEGVADKESAMAAEQAIRASDADREQVVEVLRDHYAEGRLTLDEFDERTSSAYAAKTRTDLRKLTNDLPVDLSFGPAHVAIATGPTAVAPRTLRVAPVLPILLIVALSTGFHGRGHHHFFLVFPVIPFMVIGCVLAWRWLLSRHRQ